jgi:hypothetical protein
LLERGFRIHAVELGENLASFARDRLAAFPFTDSAVNIESRSGTEGLPAHHGLKAVGSRARLKAPEARHERLIPSL